MRCEKCGVEVSDSLNICPLCFAQVSENPEKEQLYPEAVTYNRQNPKAGLGWKIISFSAVCIIAVTMLINFLTNPKNFWSGIILACVIYALFCWRVVNSRRLNIGQKIVFPMITAIISLLAIDLISNGNGWALNYVSPLLTVGATVTLAVLVFAMRLRWRDYLVFLITLIILGLIPIFLIFFGLVSVIWPSILSVFCAIVTFFGMLIFGDKTLGNELIKRFHL